MANSHLRHIRPDNMNDYQKQMQRFNVGEDCPVFDGLFEFCQISAGGSIAGAVKLNKQQTDVCINWAGGLHHAKENGLKSTLMYKSLKFYNGTHVWSEQVVAQKTFHLLGNIFISATYCISTLCITKPILEIRSIWFLLCQWYCACDFGVIETSSTSTLYWYWYSSRWWCWRSFLYYWQVRAWKT